MKNSQATQLIQIYLKTALALTLPLIFLALSARAAEDCLECHDEKAKGLNVHGAVSMGCTSCHVDHDSKPVDSPNLNVKMDQLCQQCHELPTSPWAHSSLLTPHPTAGKKDILYPEKPFNCVSCHNPHSSEMPKLFRYDYSAKTPYKGLMCAVCHWDHAYNSPPPPRPPWSK